MSMSQEEPPRSEEEARAAGDAVEKSATEVSQGLKTGHVRWVLVFGLLLGVIALGAAYLGYASWRHHAEPSPAAQAAATTQAATTG